MIGSPSPRSVQSRFGCRCGLRSTTALAAAQDRARGAVVLLERHDVRVGVVALEVEDVADVGAAPGVDALVVVAHRHHVALRLGQGPDQAVLGVVGVLVLVDQDVLEAGLPAVADGLVALQELRRDHQEVVEVHRPVVAEGCGVAPVDARQDLVVERSRQRRHLLGALEQGLRVGDPGLHRARGHALGVDLLLHQAAADQPQLVVAVVDREVAGVARLLGLAAQDAYAGRVEGRCPDGARPRAHEAPDAVPHLTGGLVGEGDGEDALRRHADLADQAGDPVGQDSGLPAPGAGQHEERPVSVEDGLALRGIEAVEQVGHPRILSEVSDAAPWGTPLA